MADNPNHSKSPDRRDIYRAPSMDNDDSPLLDPLRDRDDDKPTFRMTFSTIRVLRLITSVLSIVACNFTPRARGEHRGTAKMFTFFVVLVLLWNVIQIVGSFQHLGPKRKYEFQIGSFELSFGRARTLDFRAKKRRGYLVNLLDLGLCALMIIPSVFAFKKRFWLWETFKAVRGLCVTLAVLQFVIAVLGLFAVFRNVKVCLYPAEEDEKAAYRILGTYSDDDDERTAATPAIASV